MFEWAVNKNKLQRAQALVPGQPEEGVKEAYVKLGGLVKEPNITKQVSPEEMNELDEIINEPENVEDTSMVLKAKKVKARK